MGGAIARGLVRSGVITPADMALTVKSEVSLKDLRKQNAEWKLSTDNREAVEQADVVILAVKPWLMEEVIAGLRDSLSLDRQIVVSVAAGPTLDDLRRWLRADEVASAAVFRAIPNTAVEVMSGVTFLSERGASEEQRLAVKILFSSLGYATFVDESRIEAGMALASCGIAFAMRYIRASAEGGVELGLYPKDAQRIAALTVKGAAELLLRSGNHAEEEIDKVTTPGGITIRGLNEMEHAGFSSAVIRGLKACVKK